MSIRNLSIQKWNDRPARRLDGKADGLSIRAGAVLPLVALAIVAPMFSASLAPYDDHELPVIAQQLAEQGPLATIGTWTAEHRGRFRPGYWLLRIAETAVWGTNLAGWYFDRLLLLLATLGLGYVLARRWFGPALAVLAAVLMVAGPQAESFARAGPQEAYAVPLTLAGFVLVSRRRWSGLALLAASAFVKEPFAISALVGIAWAWRLGARRSAVAAAGVVAVALAGIALRVVSDGPPVSAIDQGRYLYPAVLAVALGAAWLTARHRTVAVALVLLAVVNIEVQWFAAQRRAAETRAFAALVASIPSDRPVLLTTQWPETAVAIRRYRPDVTFVTAPAPGYLEVMP